MKKNVALGMKHYLPLAILFIGVAYLGLRIALGYAPTQGETFLVTVILTAASWFVSASLAESSAQKAAESTANDKIDDIAWLSSKKLADQSTNFFELETYLEQTLLAKNHQTKLSETDITAIIRDLRQLRRANTGLMQDWNRVASEDLSSEINVWIEQQLELFGELDYSYGQLEGSTDSSNRRQYHLPLSARPTHSSPLVTKVDQEIYDGASPKQNKGKLHVNIARPSYNFTAGGKISPLFDSPPKTIEVQLVKSPDGTPENVGAAAGAGTNFDFSVHLKSYDFGVMLPAGTYEFEYSLSGVEPTGNTSTKVAGD
ncbi:hypothetical protein [Aliiroseovarius sp. YM-037]|uniref:hypothetical protein n=1 Tax=Aliiroseovarius sp. YM-037 TaxID=3341728 RepID=UPI003A808E51